VDQIWLQKSGANGDHNPRLVTVEQWNAFLKIWGDLATGKIDVDSFIK